MPYVNIRVTREGTVPGASATTPEEKAALINCVGDLLFAVLGQAAKHDIRRHRKSRWKTGV